jgi:hypothetical protein
VGECNYYLKARFASAERAADALPRLCELLGQGEAARAYWQAARPVSLRRGDAAPPPAEVFWAGFRERFPLVHVYLRELADTPDWNNGLAGQLSALVDPQATRPRDPRASLIQASNLVLLKLCGIWQCAELGRLERFCREELGAVAVGSLSEYDYAWGEDVPDGEYFEVIPV